MTFSSARTPHKSAMGQVLCRTSGVLFLLFLLSIDLRLSSGADPEPCVQRGKITQCTNPKHIPVLNPNTTNLRLVNFAVNNLTSHTFANLTGLPLTVLEFRRPRFRDVSTDVFRYMIHLRTLTIRYIESAYFVRTKVNLRHMFESMKYTNITNLRLYRVKLRGVHYPLFGGLRNTNLRQLVLSNCWLEAFNGTTISYLTKLRELDLSFNMRKMEVDNWGYLPVLESLSLKDSYIDHLPSFVNTTNRTGSAFPKLRRLTLSLSDDHNLNRHTFEGLPMLTRLEIQSYNKLGMDYRTIGNYLPKLTNLSIVGKPYLKFNLGNQAIFSPSLRRLELKNLTFKYIGDPLQCFYLTDLKLSQFKVENTQKLVRLLPTLQRLEYLEASHSQLRGVPASVCNLTSLTRLNLNGNSIYSWRNKNCRKVMENLREFSLAFNDIRNLNETSFAEALYNNSQLKWDLSNNNYYCTCNLLWFRDWLKRTQSRILGYPQRYRCKLSSGLKIKISNYVMTLELCNDRKTMPSLILLGVILGATSLVIIIICVIAYVKRWSVRYWCFLMWDKRRKYTSLDDNVEYIYDAFVCYSSSDINWVLNKLIPIIEDAKGFTLCLHDRDFKAGYDIVDNIVESVQTSRKVILVLSPEFASSTWCKYESSLAEQRVLEENRDILVPILLEDIPDDIQSRRLALLLKKKTYLEWTNDERGEELFWKRFADLLGAPSENVDI